MKLTYKIPSFDYQVEHILYFINDEVSDWWLEGYLHFYPDINWNEVKVLPKKEKKAALENGLFPYYEKIQQELNQKIITYQTHWDTNEKGITQALEKAFKLDLQNKFNDMVGTITLNPICPRFLDTRSFDVFYLSSEHGAMGIALHEIIHFVWFDVWQNQFHDDVLHYESPHLPWIFSEMVVDCIMRDELLTSLNPYTKDNHAIYDYFYDIIIDQVCIIDTLNELYQNNNIHDFMSLGYEYCQKHEQIIRSKIK